eukprot:2293058-Pyramimonas_sp.AAC.1
MATPKRTPLGLLPRIPKHYLLVYRPPPFDLSKAGLNVAKEWAPVRWPPPPWPPGAKISHRKHHGHGPWPMG